MDKGLWLDQLQVTIGGMALPDVSARIAPGQVLVLMGPSGSGKSSILAAISGTMTPGLSMTGRVVLDGRDITHTPPQDRGVGLLFQDDLLFPHLSVAGNLAFGLRPGGSRDTRRELVAQALSEIGLEGYGPRDPATLSGGQRARVALMRTLLAEPRALLLDEPFSRLDAGLRAQVRQMVFDTARKRALPVLLVTHDAEDAQAAEGAVVTLGASKGEGPVG